MKHETFPLEGEWLPFRAEMDGVEAPELVIKRTRLSIRGTRYVIDFAGETSDRGSIALAEDETAGPAQLSFTSSHGENDGRVLAGIYQLRGDLLRLCFGLDGRTPTDFAAPANSQRYLILYRREK